MLFDLVVAGEEEPTTAAMAAKKLCELGDSSVQVSLKSQLKETLTVTGYSLFRPYLVRELLAWNDSKSTDLLVYLMDDWRVTQEVLREMSDAGRFNQELIDRAEAMLPIVTDKPSAEEMKYFLARIQKKK